MKQLIICLFVNCLVFGTVMCQERTAFFAIVSYNSFSMSNLKEVQQQLLNDLEANNIPAKIVESYPQFYGYKIGFLTPLNREDTSALSIGGILDYTSTGGRIHYQDYSGEIREDEVASVTSVGGILDYIFYDKKILSMSAQVSARYFFSSLSYSFYSRIGDNVSSEKLIFKSSSIGFEPSIILKKEILGAQVGLAFSWLVYIPSSVTYENQSDAYLINKGGNKVEIDWSGFRMGVIAGFSL